MGKTQIEWFRWGKANDQEMCEKMSNLINNLRKRNKSNTEIIGTFSAYNFNSDLCMHLTIELVNYPAHMCVSLSLFSHHLLGKYTIWIRQIDSIKIEISLCLYTQKLLKILLKILFTYFMCVRRGGKLQNTCEGHRKLCGVGSLLPTVYGFQELNSGPQACIASTFTLLSHLIGPGIFF